MRLARVIRRAFPVPALRAGIPPTWDRPDPPASQKTEWNRRLTMQDKHFTFFDASSPLYMLVNSEVAEGDPLEALPNFVKRVAAWFLVAFLFGSVGALWGSKQKVQTVTNYLGQKQRQQTEKKQKEEKYGVKDIINNPWNLNSLPETFPLGNFGIIEPTNEYLEKTKAIDAIRQVNREGLAYWNSLYQSSKEKVKSGGKHH